MIREQIIEELINKIELGTTFGRNGLRQILLELKAKYNCSDTQSQFLAEFISSLDKTNYGKNELILKLLKIAIDYI